MDSVFPFSITIAFGTTILFLNSCIFLDPFVFILAALILQKYRLNQCVGELNHKYFLLFLIINSAFFIYATIVISLVLVSEVYEKDLMNATFYNHITGEV